MKNTKPIQIPDLLHKRIKLCCIKRDISMIDFCKIAFEKMLKEYETGDIVINYSNGKYGEFFPITKENL